MASVNLVAKRIKKVYYQGASNIAKAALGAYASSRDKPRARQILTSVRPTEPLIDNLIRQYNKNKNLKQATDYISKNKRLIAKEIAKHIRDGTVIFTHCHSSTVVEGLRYAKKLGKKFAVYNTETRPLFQGRRTTQDLARANIPVTEIVDSAAGKYLKMCDIFLFGADAITPDGVINKIGTGMIAEIAYNRKIPCYSCSHALKFTKKTKMEMRSIDEVWVDEPKGVKIKNPAFEFVPNKFVKGIISEYGTLSPSKFRENVRKNYSWLK